MSQEPTDTPQPRGLRGPASRGTARGRAGLGGRPRLEAPTSRHLALPGTDTNIPAPPSSTTIPNSGDADDLPAPLSLTTIPGSGRANDSGTRLDEALPAPNAVGSRELATVDSPRPAAPPAPSGDAGTRPSGTPDTLAVGTNTAEQSAALSASLGDADTNLVSALTTRSAERSVAATHSGVGETALTTRRTPKPSATQASSLKLHPTVAASLGTLRDSTRRTALVAQSRLSAVQVRQYVAAQVYRWMSREPGIVQPLDPYYPDRHHWPMRAWLLEKKETVRHLREIASGGGPKRPWTANFRSECLCLPVVTDPMALQVDLEELRFSSGARDFTSVIATLQTMMHYAGYAFLNLVPTWGRTLSPELLAAQDGQFMSDASFLSGLLTVEQVAWNEIAQGRQYRVRRDDAPFQTLDPEVTSTFRLEDDGDTLMLTPEEQELLGVAMVTRLRLAHAAQAKLSQEAWDRREAEFQERTAREMERRKVSDQDFAGIQAQMYLLEKERAQERKESIQFRAEADRRMEAVTEKCDQAISKAAAAIDETKFQADEELSRIRREMEHQAREDRAREAREVELQEDQLEELRMYREQAAAGSSRRQPRERVSSPRSNGTGVFAGKSADECAGEWERGAHRKVIRSGC
ncbi:hypothetical protein PHMEG_00027541 [Phytophthora megakarya]|uniref:Uncharacterized protein n=1 Tax=Phytophthora megakarya TaxID=4795 RepID=A0A225V706_9STRA|nr:hypothetical protein PHMEG_00027541 [Phytophthora megakarya]